MKAIEIWRLISKSMENKIPSLLLYVLESKGSSPGRQGFCMAVNAKGEMEGSVGGGIMEHKFVEMAREQLQTHRAETEVRKQIHDKSAGNNQSGMICSGEQTIFLYPVKESDKETISAIISSMEQNKNGTLGISPAGISFTPVVPAADYFFYYRSEEEWAYREKTGYKNQLYIIGGGHCALALSKLMRDMDFYITLYEEREGLNTLLKNKYAHEINVVDDYTGLGNLIPSGPGQYVVIMTFGYRSDDIALRSLLHKPFTYLGMLGSKSKMEKLFNEYRQEGFGESMLQLIHTPVGLDINSQTPEEIAVSIAAQIIRVKNNTPQ